MNTKNIIVCLFLSVFTLTGFAINLSPVGNWTTISDKTDKARSVIKIWKSKGELYGKVIKIYKEPGDTGKCVNCSGKFKDKKVDGLTIMWGLEQTGVREWRKGKILDPKSGHIYSCELHVAPDGQSLEVRGYIGFSLFGRNQTWLRDVPNGKNLKTKKK